MRRPPRTMSHLSFREVSLSVVAGVFALLILRACQEADPLAPIATSPPSPYVAQVNTPLRDCPQTTCAVQTTMPVKETAPILERIDENGERYWLKLEYQEGQTLYAGPFIIMASSSYAVFREARTCASYDCPVRFTLPQAAKVLWLETVLVNLDQYWTRIGYNGEELFIGPYVPIHSDTVSTAVIAA